MSASKMSRNRDDYSKSTHILIEAGADVFFNGDIDRAWEALFAHSEWYAQFEATDGRVNDSAILHLRATSRLDNPRLP